MAANGALFGDRRAQRGWLLVAFASGAFSAVGISTTPVFATNLTRNGAIAALHRAGEPVPPCADLEVRFWGLANVRLTSYYPAG